MRDGNERMSPVLQTLQTLVDELAAFPEVQRVLLFGSRARGDAEERSDIDLAVDLSSISQERWFKMVSMVEDARTLLTIDFVRLDRVPRALKTRIESEGKVLFERRAS